MHELGLFVEAEAEPNRPRLEGSSKGERPLPIARRAAGAESAT